MSDASSNTVKTWGPIAGVVLGFMAYKVPEHIMSGLVPLLLPILPKSDNVSNFILYGLFEALTIGAIFMLVTWYRSSFRKLGLNRFKFSYIYQAILGFCSYFVITNVALNLIAQFYHVPDEQQAIGFTGPTGIELVLVFTALVFIVPLAEELLFRGFIYKGIRNGYSFPVTAIVVSVLFAVAHGQLNVGIDVFCLSLVLCYLREKSGSIWPGVLLHGLKNAVAFAVLFIFK
jgi:membrane protease YdiL (CAAX protease family)